MEIIAESNNQTHKALPYLNVQALPLIQFKTNKQYLSSGRIENLTTTTTTTTTTTKKPIKQRNKLADKEPTNQPKKQASKQGANLRTNQQTNQPNKQNYCFRWYTVYKYHVSLPGNRIRRHIRGARGEIRRSSSTLVPLASQGHGCSYVFDTFLKGKKKRETLMPLQRNRERGKLKMGSSPYIHMLTILRTLSDKFQSLNISFDACKRNVPGAR